MSAETVTVALGNRSYPIKIGIGVRQEVLAEAQRRLSQGARCVVITSPGVAKAQADFVRMLAQVMPVHVTKQDGETAKSVAKAMNNWFSWIMEGDQDEDIPDFFEDFGVSADDYVLDRESDIDWDEPPVARARGNRLSIVLESSNTVDTIEELRANYPNVKLVNMVSGHTIEPPFVGLGLVAFELGKVTEEDKLRARGGDHYYIANHMNNYGILAKCDYTTRNTQNQPFIYMNTFGSASRPTAVRLDLLRKLVGEPIEL